MAWWVAISVVLLVVTVLASSFNRQPQLSVGRWKYYFATRYDPTYESHSFGEEGVDGQMEWCREETVAGFTFFFGRVTSDSKVSIPLDEWNSTLR